MDFEVKLTGAPFYDMHVKAWRYDFLVIFHPSTRKWTFPVWTNESEDERDADATRLLKEFVGSLNAAVQDY